MKIIQQLGLIFGLCWLCQWVERILPVSIPAGVLALLLLLLLLLTGAVKTEQLRETSNFFLNNLPFFFLPVSVGIMEYTDVIFSHAAAFLTVCVVSLVLTFAATVWTVRLTTRWLEGRKKA
ncbi:MAG: CidA/LrgA family protein [Oscillibacter sp.]